MAKYQEKIADQILNDQFLSTLVPPTNKKKQKKKKCKRIVIQPKELPKQESIITDQIDQLSTATNNSKTTASNNNCQEPEIVSILVTDLIQPTADDGFILVTKKKPQRTHRKKKNKQQQFHHVADLPSAKPCNHPLLPPKLEPQSILEYAPLTEKIFSYKLKNDFQQKVNSLILRSNHLSPLRMLIIQRLQFILNQFNSTLKLSFFGSTVTGLSLPTSDIDINIIDPSGNENSEHILTLLLEILEPLKWVNEAKGIFTASVPVLKLKVDPLQPFTSSCSFLDLPFNTYEIYSSENIEINVDITMQSFCTANYSFQPQYLKYMGELSTELVNMWLAHYPPLFALAIFFKDLLSSNSWNNTYKGGFSSYSIVIILVAFLKFRDFTNSLNYSHILMLFFQFFGLEFNPNELGISLSQPNPFIPIDSLYYPPNDPPKICILDPLNEQSNLTKNAYNTSQILKKFAEIHSNLQQYKCELKELLQNLKLSKDLLNDNATDEQLVQILVTQYQQFAEFYSKDIIIGTNLHCNKLL